MQKLLITNNHLATFAGSEMVTLELVEEFATRGWEIDVYTNYLAPPFSYEFATLKDRCGVHVSDRFMSRGLSEYDLIWVNHGVLPLSAIDEFSRIPYSPPVVWNHMSTVPGVESPILADVESLIASIITFNSFETREELVRYGLPRSRSLILPNPVPRAFCEVLQPREQGKSTGLRTVLVISNHSSPERDLAMEMLANRGVRVIRVGDGIATRVTPESFFEVDAVVSIGKSVQYALCLGIPVYVYDHFGGPGWITQDTFDHAAHFNFSGRPEKRTLEASAIVNELLNGFDAARTFALDTQQERQMDFSLQLHVDEILSRLNKENQRAPLPKESIKRWYALASMQRESTRQIRQFRAQLAESNSRIKSLEESAAASTNEHQRLLHSRSFRLGNAILRPLRKLWRL